MLMPMPMLHQLLRASLTSPAAPRLVAALSHHPGPQSVSVASVLQFFFHQESQYSVCLVSALESSPSQTLTPQPKQPPWLSGMRTWSFDLLHLSLLPWLLVEL